MITLLFLFISLTSASFHYSAGKKRYDDDKIVRVKSSPALFEAISKFEIDMFGSDGKFTTIRVSSAQMEELSVVIPEVGMEVLVENIQEVLDNEDRVLKALGNPVGEQWFSSYHTYSDIVKWYTNLADLHSDLVSMEQIGTSHEKREIYALKVTSSAGNQILDKPQIFIQGQIHAREWISGATVQYIFFNLITKYGKDPIITKILDNSGNNTINERNFDNSGIKCRRI